MFAALGPVPDKLLTSYANEQLATILDLLERATRRSCAEIAKISGAAADTSREFSKPETDT